MEKIKSIFLYVTETDISIDNGPGINEREFVNTLLNEYPDEVICILQYPEFPENHYDEKIEYVKNHGKFNKLIYFIYVIQTIRRIQKLKKKYHIKALVVRLGYSPIVPLISYYFFGIPLIIKTLLKYSTYSGRANWKGRILNRILFPLFKLTIRKSIFIDTASKPYVQWIENKFGQINDKTAVIRNVTNVERFVTGNQIQARKELNINKFGFIIGYIGAFSKNRYLEELILAFNKIQNGNNAGLIFVGDGVLKKKLQKMTEENSLSNKIIFTGQVPYELVPKYMQSFDVAVDLTLMKMKIGDKIINSSYSQKSSQYLACGTPVVAWDIPDNHFIKNENLGDIAEFGNVEELAESIKRLMKMSKEELKELGNNASLYAREHLSISVLTKRRIQYWCKIIDNK